MIDWRANAKPEDLVVESWGQGFVVGALIIMACVTVANMRRRVLLHKLILAELLCAMMHGTFCFMEFRGYGWYLSSTASLLYVSSWIHNFVAWLKIRPFVVEPNYIFTLETGKIIAMTYRITLALSVVPISLQIVNNFQYFNNINERYAAFRPYETLMRDPWWVFTCFVLFHVIAKCYGTGTLELIKRSPRFGILLVAIALAMVFTIMDIVASVQTRLKGRTNGINPWWKLYLVFKCVTDTIMLDDFKTELSRLRVAPRQPAHQQATSPGYHDLENHGLNEMYAPVGTRVNSTAGSQSLDDRLLMSRTAKSLSTIRVPINSHQIKITRLSTLEDGRSECDKPATWHREHTASEFELVPNPSSFLRPMDAPHGGISYGQ